MWGGHYDMNWGWGWWVIGPLMMILFWGGLFWLFAAVARGCEQPAGAERGDDPLQITARRFAAGEIDEAEYTQIRERLDR